MNQHFATGSLKARAIASTRDAAAADVERQPRIPLTFVRASARVLDLAIAMLTGAIAAHAPSPIAIIVIGVAALASFEALGLYRLSELSSLRASAARLVAGWFGAFAVLTPALALGLDAGLSGTTLAFWIISGALGLVGARFAFAHRVQKWMHDGRLAQRMAIYGTGPLTEELIAAIERNKAADLRMIGVYADGNARGAPSKPAATSICGGIEDLVACGRAGRLDLIVLAIPLAQEERLATVAQRLAVLPVEVKLHAGATSLRFGRRLTSRLGEVALIDLVDRPIGDWGLLAKSTFDKVVALAALLLLAPLMLAVAAAVKLDSRGPVLFRQKRYGYNNQLIEIFKFRSMYVESADATAASLVTKCDPRVTRVGRFIRRTSLDELPQLLNVIRGDLSLVGPRPHALEAKAGDTLYSGAVEGYFARHKVKPGITGWAQINGWRGETDTIEKIRKRVEHDLYYIENWSLLLDLAILARTPAALLGENAY